MGTRDMTLAGNYNHYGLTVQLTPWWTRHTVLFDDPNFSQPRIDSPATFDPSQVDGILFMPGSPGPLDFGLDDVTLLKVPQPDAWLSNISLSKIVSAAGGPEQTVG